MTDVLVELNEGVMVITLNRPDRLNALGGTLVKEFVEALTEARRSDDVRSVVVTGAGRGFCAGADLQDINVSEVGGGAGAGRSRYNRLNRRGADNLVIMALHDVDKPTIGAINGPAAGGGLGVATAFDIRIASEQARFTTAFIKRGLAPDFGTSWFLPKLVGPERAYEMFYTGRQVDAAEALRIGLVSKVVPREQLMDSSLELAREIAAMAPLAMTYTRRALRASAVNPLERHLEMELTQQLEAFKTEDVLEGVAAWREKRSPVFRGR